MTQDTKSKFAAILAAQQAKVSVSAAIKQINNANIIPDSENLKAQPLIFEDTYLTLDELHKVSVTDFINSPNLINDIASDEDEISNTTIADILGEDQPKAKLTLVDYSVKSFAIIGDTRPIKDQLRQLGGKFNYYLTCGAGWIFPKTKAYTVRKALNLI